ncbi:MAG: MFS transporter [Holosporaceae bacterium]|jgi:MFS family permease|nr:MFS transporter [Holosporaceae bacterium]
MEDRIKDSDQKKNGFLSVFSTLPKGVCATSLFGLFLGMSTTMIYSQFSLFLTHEMGASASKVTIFDGLVECLSFVVRIFSGCISDFLKERKLILYAGCFITLIARIFISTSTSWTGIVLAQSSERMGNGIQATPRDALIADLSPQHLRARSFGFSRSMKTVGALSGTLIAVLIMHLTNANYRFVFACAVVPVVVAIICLSSVKTPREISGKNNDVNIKPENPFKKKYLKSLDENFWKLLLLALIFEMGHFTEHMFPIYTNRFLSVGLSGTVSSFVSIGQVLMSFPIGILADKYGKKKLIAVCMICMIAADVFFISAPSVGIPIINIYAGAFLWGGQMTAIQGLFLSLISERVDSHLKATAMGVYFLMLGVGYLTASALAGLIWDHWGSSFAFLYSMFFSFMALILSKTLLIESAR